MVLEVPKKELPEGVEERKIHFYGLSGWHTQPVPVRDQGGEEVFSAICFGGYLKYDPIDGTLGGELVDVGGRSRIEGKMSEEELVLVKLYPRTGTRVNFKFERDEEGMWGGKYQSVSVDGVATASGFARCQTTLLEREAFHLLSGDGQARYVRQGDIPFQDQ